MKIDSFLKKVVFFSPIIIFIVQPLLGIAQGKAVPDSIQTEFKGYPVNPLGETIFYVKASIGFYTAKNRARTITDLIRMPAKDPSYTEDSLFIVNDEGTVNVNYGSHVITSVNLNKE